jgi:glycosyltransferase involved in cell wall biosynthesis
MVGRLEKTKGFHKVIEQFRQGSDTRVIIAGTGPYENELKQLAQGADNIIFTGYLEYEKLVGLYKSAVAVIVPSIWQEPFGLIVLEAFAQATPVIVNNSGALPELARSSGGGLVYTTGEQLQEHVTMLENDPEKRQELGASGRNAFLNRWTEDIHLEQYFGIISQARKAKAQGVI